MTVLSLAAIGSEPRDMALGAQAEMWRHGLQQHERSGDISVADWKARVLSLLAAVVVDAAVPGWDGYDAHPVTAGAFAYARALLSGLAGRVPRPDISAHPDGEIALEWERDASHHFTVAVGRDGTLTYYGAFGVAVSKGIEMLGDTVPLRVLDGIERVFARA